MDRDAKGRFAKGTTGNPNGRPPRATEEEYVGRIRDAVSPERWKKVVEQMLKRAENGDVHSARFIAEYLLGRPKQRLDLTSDDRPLKGYAVVSPDDWPEGATTEDKPSDLQAEDRPEGATTEERSD